MSHVREGELHAYLDGALDRLGADVADRVRHHLAECEDCQSRIEQERELRERASALLERALPAEIVAPPFEELRRRAAVGDTASSPAKPASKGVNFPAWKWGWAASVVLALGTGWMMRGSNLELGNFSQAPIAATESARLEDVAQIEPADEAEGDQEAPALAESLREDRSNASAPPSAASLDRLASTVEGRPVESASPDAAGQRSRQAVESPETQNRLVQDQLAVRDATDAPQRRTAAEAAVRELEERAEPQSEVVSDSQLVVEEAVAGADTRAAGVASPLPATAGVGSTSGNPAANEGNASDGGPVAILDRPVLALIDNPDGGPPGILQQLANGDSVMLVWSGDAVAASGVSAFGASKLENQPNAQENDARENDEDAAVRRKVALSEGGFEDLAAAQRSMGRLEAWPTVIRIRRGSALLTVYGTGSETELRAALVAAGLAPSS
jgi:hypothetical protein